ncbi:hypothetical protein J7L05_08910 [bacterium]|nr:hypothetical protein [bacterium]
MIRGYLIPALLLVITIYIMHQLNIMWDPVFVILVFFSLMHRSIIFPIAGMISCVIGDHLLLDSSGFFTFAGIIIYGSAIWLRESFPLARKPLVIIMAPVYSQFLWFMLLFGYYLGEGSGNAGVGYFAPFLIGNTLITICLAFIFFSLRARDTRKDFSPGLLKG